MPDILEAISSVFKTLVDDEPRPPLHVGEVTSCWLYLAFLENALGISQAALNTTTDNDLSSALHEELNLINMQMTELKKFMVDEGIPLPRATEQKPKCDSSQIPAGVKLTDYEIANELSLKIASAMVACATNSAEAIRNDVSMMFSKFYAQKLTYGSSLKTMMRKKGWINIPPSYVPAGIPNSKQ